MKKINFNNLLKVVGDILFGILILIALVFLVSFLPIKNNYKLFTVMSGSMEPKIKTGSIIFTQPSGSYGVGDIITFNSNDASGKKDTTTHRIFSETVQGGQTMFATKGDANNAPDSQSIYKDQIVGKYMFGIPYVGYLLAYIKTLTGLIIIIIIAAIIVYEEMRKIHRETKQIIVKRREAKNGPRIEEAQEGVLKDEIPIGNQLKKRRKDVE
jgi:signal peptidase